MSQAVWYLEFTLDYLSPTVSDVDRVSVIYKWTFAQINFKRQNPGNL